MITYQKKGFLTASVLLLFLCLTISFSLLNLTGKADYARSSISAYDRDFIRAKDRLTFIEGKIKAGEMPTYEALRNHCLKVRNEVYLAPGITLRYLDIRREPMERLLFQLIEDVFGWTYVSPCEAIPDEAGDYKLHLRGISH